MSRSLLTDAQHRSVQVSHKETEKTEAHHVKEFIKPREDEGECSSKDQQSPNATVTGEAEPLTTQGSNEQTEEEHVGDEDCKAPLELLIKFLGALMDENYRAASKLCEMILSFEPENPEASEFLPLIQRKLQEGEEQKEERSEEEEDDDDDAHSESDEGSSSTSSSSSSSCSSSSSDDEGGDGDEDHVEDD